MSHKFRAESSRWAADALTDPRQLPIQTIFQLTRFNGRYLHSSYCYLISQSAVLLFNKQVRTQRLTPRSRGLLPRPAFDQSTREWSPYKKNSRNGKWRHIIPVHLQQAFSPSMEQRDPSLYSQGGERSLRRWDTRNRTMTPAAIYTRTLVEAVQHSTSNFPPDGSAGSSTSDSDDDASSEHGEEEHDPLPALTLFRCRNATRVIPTIFLNA